MNAFNFGELNSSHVFPHQLQHTKILVVEDNEDISEALCDFLTFDTDFDVDAVVNGQLALDYLDSHLFAPPALILLDIMMPVMDGIAFLHQLTLSYPKFKIPIIILSAVMDVQPHKLVVEQLSKPVDLLALIGKAKKYTNIKEDACSLI